MPTELIPSTIATRIKEVFFTFLQLGISSFGGPIAHLGYFRHECVERRQWISESAYADLVALCQFLPGPASSQVAFALGLLRAGPWGAAAAWMAFTLPSAFAILAFATGTLWMSGPLGAGAIHGLKLVAVIIVAQAVYGMARQLCPDVQRAGIASLVLLGMSFIADPHMQIIAIIGGGCAGLWLCRHHQNISYETLHSSISKATACVLLILFFIILAASFTPDQFISSAHIKIFNAFYQAGALVFGGGHVVLPLLEAAVVQKGWIEPDAFLAGYGATQALPGPLFTFAAYLGALIHIGPQGIIGASLALFAIFLPGTLLITGALPFWSQWRALASAQAFIKGTNAAVVGLLAYALYASLLLPTIRQSSDVMLTVVGFCLLVYGRLPPWIIVAAGVAISLLMNEHVTLWG